MVNPADRKNIMEYELSPYATPLWEKYDLTVVYSEKDWEGIEPPTKKLILVKMCHDAVCKYLEDHS